LHHLELGFKGGRTRRGSWRSFQIRHGLWPDGEIVLVTHSQLVEVWEIFK